MALIGDSIKLKVHFKDFDGQYVDPTDIKFKIYNQQKEQIGTNVDITYENRESVGVYTYNYQIPNTEDCLIFEFSGNNSGVPILIRKSLNITFV